MESVELVDCSSLAPGSRIDVETKSRHYFIECLGGNGIRISGHPEYCPEPVHVRLHGAVDHEGTMEFGIIGRGKRLMFFLDGQRPVTTSRVMRVHVIPSPANPTSVH
jgi:hypothetical protein